MASISSLPREILIHIFKFLFENNKQVRIVEILSEVCPEWKRLCMDSYLWKKYDGTLDFKNMIKLKKEGYFKQTEEMIISTTNKLTNEQAIELFSELTNLKVVNFYKVEKLDNDVLSVLAESCPNLNEIHFNLYKNKYKYTKPGQLPIHLNYDKINNFLCIAGAKLITINLTCCSIGNVTQIVRCISDCCPNLQHLNLTSCITHSAAVFPTKYVQERCTNLKVLHLDSNIRIGKNRSELGFQNLEVFTYYDKTGYVLLNGELYCVLFNSVHLKFLNLTNCSVSGEILSTLPACSVEYLYISKSKICNSQNLSEILQKWSHSLKEIDISGSVNDSLNEAVSCFTVIPGESPLEYLNLNATKVTANTIIKVLLKCKKLESLHLESCRNLGRGMKKVYHGKSDLNILLKNVTLFAKTE